MKHWIRFFSLSLLSIAAGMVSAQTTTDVVEISTVDDLKAFRDAVNSGTTYAGQTVKLTADLDLSGESNWTPIGNVNNYESRTFYGTFDGDGHSISNLTSSDYTPENAAAGLFGSVVNGTIKNLTVKNVNLTSTHYAGGIVAYTSNKPTIENCHVIGGTIKSTPEIVRGSYDNGDKVGGIMGYATAGSTINNCTVQDVTISVYRDLGGIVGYSAGIVTNNTTIDVTVTQDTTNGYKDPTPSTVGDIVGGGSASDKDYVVENGNKALKSVAKIGETKYQAIDAAVAAANEGETIEVIVAGDYTLPNLPLNVTIEGAVDGVVFKHIVAKPGNENNIANVPNGATFKNVTFDLGNINYHGFVRANINMENCTINGKLFSYGDMNFTNCQFVQTNSDYNMWVYGAGNVVYDQCTFTNTTTGKMLHLYCEDANLQHIVTVKDCKFVNEGSLSKAAINVKATSGSNVLQYVLYLEGNNTYDGNFPTAVGEQDNADKTWGLGPLAQVDDRKVSPDNIKVYENDVLIYPVYVAQIDGVKYLTLQDAFDAAEAADMTDIVIDLLGNATLDITARNNVLWIGTENTKSITINGNGKTLTFNQKNSDWNDVSTKNDEVTTLILNDMKITNTGYNNSAWNRHDINFSCAVELNNVTSDKALAFKNDATLNNVTISDDGSNSVDTKISDVYGIWIQPKGQNVTINGLNLTAQRGIKIDSQYIEGNSSSVTLNIANATFNTTKKSAILVNSPVETYIHAGEGINIENVAADKEYLVWVDEAKAEEFYKVSVEGAKINPETKEEDYVACLLNGEQRWGYYKSLSKAIDKVEEGYSIRLHQTTDEAVEVSKPLTITKNGYTADNVTAGEGYMRLETEKEIVICVYSDPVLKDWDEEYVYPKGMAVSKVTYLRNFSSTQVGKYQAWYVPFDYTITADDENDFQFYRISMIAAAAEAGTVDNVESIYIYLQPVGEGTVLKANRPYVVVPNQAVTAHEFVAENIEKLYPIDATSRLNEKTTHFYYQ